MKVTKPAKTTAVPACPPTFGADGRADGRHWSYDEQVDILESIADKLACADLVPQIDPKDDRGWLQIAWDALRRRRHNGEQGSAAAGAAPARREP